MMMMAVLSQRQRDMTPTWGGNETYMSVLRTSKPITKTCSPLKNMSNCFITLLLLETATELICSSSNLSLGLVPPEP